MDFIRIRTAKVRSLVNRFTRRASNRIAPASGEVAPRQVQDKPHQVQDKRHQD